MPIIFDNSLVISSIDKVLFEIASVKIYVKLTWELDIIFAPEDCSLSYIDTYSSSINGENLVIIFFNSFKPPYTK